MRAVASRERTTGGPVGASRSGQAAVGARSGATNVAVEPATRIQFGTTQRCAIAIDWASVIASFGDALTG